MGSLNLLLKDKNGKVKHEYDSERKIDKQGKHTVIKKFRKSKDEEFTIIPIKVKEV